jgi:hypothetical protein
MFPANIRFTNKKVSRSLSKKRLGLGCFRFLARFLKSDREKEKGQEKEKEQARTLVFLGI